MDNREMALKVVLGKHIIEDMLDIPFWQNLITDQQRLLAATERALAKLPVPEPFPVTDREMSDLLFAWTLPVRAEVAVEFLPKGADA